MKKIIYTPLLALICLLTIQCTREVPDYINGLELQTRMPAEFKPEISYSFKEVSFSSASRTYTFETDENGVLIIDELIPDVYTINTYYEITGRDYKQMVEEEVFLPDDARILLSATLGNVPVYSAHTLLLDIESSIQQGLLISKIYYSGTKDNLNRNYITDAFVEIFNNSDEVLYIDGKYLALAESRSPSAYLAADNPDYIYTRQIVKFPGEGTDYPIEPGKSIVIATRSARDHTQSASASVDLSDADFEVKDSDGMGNPAIKALPVISSSTSLRFFNLLTGAPNAIFLFETDEDVLEWPEFYTPGMSSGERFRRVPVETVIDGVEALRNSAGSGPDPSQKRLHNFIDAGFTFITATSGYVNESVERRVSRIEDGRVILQDTNNSSVDFEVISGPAPRKYDHPELLK